MTERAHTLAQRFKEANAELIAFVEACSDADWNARCPNEGWPVAAAAHHIAVDHPLLSDLARRVFAGDPMPELTMADVHEMNRQHAQDFARCSKDEVLKLLHSNGADITAFIRVLTDGQLDRTAVIPWWGAAAVTAEQVIDELIHHVPEHLSSMRVARAEATRAKSGVPSTEA